MRITQLRGERVWHELGIGWPICYHAVGWNYSAAVEILLVRWLPEGLVYAIRADALRTHLL